jgi:hypothetical protein
MSRILPDIRPLRKKKNLAQSRKEPVFLSVLCAFAREVFSGIVNT